MSIPLDKIEPGAFIRFSVIHETQYLSVKDFIIHVCSTDKKKALEIWVKATEQLNNEISWKMFRFPGINQPEQPVITFQCAVEFSRFLPFKLGKDRRNAILKILSEHFNGNGSLITQTNDNIGDCLIHSENRFDLNEIMFSLKRKRDEVEFHQKELRRAEINSQLACITKYNSLCVDDTIDKRTKKISRDNIGRFLLGKSYNKYCHSAKEMDIQVASMQFDLIQEKAKYFSTEPIFPGIRCFLN